MKMQYGLLMLVASCAQALHLPSSIKICNQSSIDHGKCLNSAMEGALLVLEKGLPEFNFPPTQPVNVTSMTIGEGTGAVHVVQKYKDVHIYNLMNPKIHNSRLNLTGSEFKLHADLFYEEVRLEADYDFNGKVLVLPIVGAGKCTLKLKKLSCEIDLTGELIKRKGKDYIEIAIFKISLNPGKVEYDFQDLFNGDERLGKEVNALLNNNWKEVFDDVKAGYEELFGDVCKSYANLIFRKVSSEELFPV